MDKVNGKTKFNLIDIFVILTIIVIIVAVVVVVVTRKDDASKTAKQPISFTVKITPVSEDNLGMFKVGDVAFDSATGNEYGKIAEIKTEKVINVTNSYSVDEEGNKVANAGEYENLYVVYLTITGECVLDERKIPYVSGNRILVGAPLYFADGNYATSTFVTNFVVGGK
jgi:hypothetical protein